MRIALHDADSERLHKKRFPNYALMKIAAYHKQQGDAVDWWTPLLQYDRVYSSKIFDFTPENIYLPPDTVKGGTGYNVRSRLPPEVERVFPDYSIYPHCDFAIGYITRGCPNRCRWCVVPEKEGGIKPYREWRELVRPDSKKLVLMDNNILASPFGRSETGRWVEKAYNESRKPGTTVVMLIPARTDTKWFHGYIEGKAEIRFVKGRLKFGGSKDGAPFPSMVVVFRASPTEEEARRAGRIIKRYCVNRTEISVCPTCPIRDMCHSEPYRWGENNNESV